MKNLLFIPCYNCAPQISRVLKSLNNSHAFFDVIILVDNLSRDKTQEVALDSIQNHPLRTKLSIVQNPENVGLGGTHKLVFHYALENNFDHVVILHGDDQGRIDDFTEVFKKAQTEVIEEFIMGARFHSQSRLNNYSKFRIFGNLVFNKLASIMTSKKIDDLGGSGLNLFPVKLIRSHQFNAYSNDLTFHVYLLLNAIRLNQKVRFAPISWGEDDQISNVRLFKQSKKLIKILLRYFWSSKTAILEEGMVFAHKPAGWKLLNR